MIEFFMRPKGGVKAETTIIGFRDIRALLDFVREVEEVTIVYEGNDPVILVDG